jgi:hypothetical protein
MLDISKIKIEIITKQNVPININNPVLNYTKTKIENLIDYLCKFFMMI